MDPESLNSPLNREDEQRISLPTSGLLGAIALVSAAAAAAWATAASLASWDHPTRSAGIWGAVIVGVVAAASILAITTWKPRPIAVWMSFWMGATAIRLLVTPVLAWLLYSATRLPGQALVLAVAATYFISLLAEAIVLARHVGRVTRTQSQQDSAGTH